MEDYFRKITEYYKPSEPINNPELFVGREKEKTSLYKSLVSNGKCPIIFGVRGVGKTSLLNITCNYFSEQNNYTIIKHICSKTDNFQNIFNTFLRNNNINTKLEKITTKKNDDISGGLNFSLLKMEVKDSASEEKTLNQLTETTLTPSLISEIFRNEKLLLILDEFDRIKNPDDLLLIAETIKAISDNNSETKIILSGVGNSMIDLVSKHQSILRSFKPIKVPRMIEKEIIEIITNGTKNLKISFDEDIVNNIIWLSDGLPYFTHLISECLADYAYFNEKMNLNIEDLINVLNNVVENMSLKEIVEINYARSYEKNNFINNNTTSGSSLLTSFFNQNKSIELSIINDKYTNITLQTVLNLLSKYENDDNEIYQIIFNEYNNLRVKNVLLQEIEEHEIELILNIISKKSEIIFSLDDKYFFKDSYHKVYTRIKYMESIK